MARVLRGGFNGIHRRFRDQLNDDWPPDVCLRPIEYFVSGFFAFFSTISRFVGDANIPDPNGQLQICMISLEVMVHLGLCIHCLRSTFFALTSPLFIAHSNRSIPSLTYRPRLKHTIHCSFPPRTIQCLDARVTSTSMKKAVAYDLAIYSLSW